MTKGKGSFSRLVPVSLMASLVLAFPIFASQPGIKLMSETELIEAAKADAEVQILSSESSDPIGREGLWGMSITFIIDQPADVVFNIMIDIEKYPERMDKVKRVEVIERFPGGMITEYTEGGWGIESNTSTVKWMIDRLGRTVTSQSIGEDDIEFWSQTRVEETSHPGYSRLTSISFVDTGLMPKFIMNWITNIAGEASAEMIREMIALGVSEALTQ